MFGIANFNFTSQNHRQRPSPSSLGEKLVSTGRPCGVRLPAVSLVIFGAIALAALPTERSMAADLPVKAAVPTAYNWSGCYAGGNAGLGMTQSDYSTTVDNGTHLTGADPGVVNALVVLFRDVATQAQTTADGLRGAGAIDVAFINLPGGDDLANGLKVGEDQAEEAAATAQAARSARIAAAVGRPVAFGADSVLDKAQSATQSKVDKVLYPQASTCP